MLNIGKKDSIYYKVINICIQNLRERLECDIIVIIPINYLHIPLPFISFIDYYIM